MPICVTFVNCEVIGFIINNGNTLPFTIIIITTASHLTVNIAKNKKPQRGNKLKRVHELYNILQVSSY